MLPRVDLKKKESGKMKTKASVSQIKVSLLNATTVCLHV